MVGIVRVRWFVRPKCFACRVSIRLRGSKRKRADETESVARRIPSSASSASKFVIRHGQTSRGRKPGISITDSTWRADHGETNDSTEFPQSRCAGRLGSYVHHQVNSWQQLVGGRPRDFVTRSLKFLPFDEFVRQAGLGLKAYVRPYAPAHLRNMLRFPYNARPESASPQVSALTIRVNRP